MRLFERLDLRAVVGVGDAWSFEVMTAPRPKQPLLHSVNSCSMDGVPEHGAFYTGPGNTVRVKDSTVLAFPG